jgi:hypothetical protein
MNSKGLITDISWHPEFSDNQFGCCLTDGSIFIISIGDIDSKTTTILSYMPSTNSAMSLCWSPKGKQIVIGFKNGYFSQYKLVNGQQLQEVKKTVLPNNLTDYSVLSIKWIVSSLFAIACTKDLTESEKDTHIILVSTPSKGLSQFVDFGAICLDNYEVNDSYRINLLHYENMILCSTSMSSEVAVIGCDSAKDISLPDNWCQWMLDDNSRIDLPMDRDGNDTFIRGIAISKGTQNTFKISANEVYGGISCPLLLTYNSSGILLPYLIIENSGNLKVPEAPNIVKPVINASITSSDLSTNTSIQSSLSFNPQQTSVSPQLPVSKPSNIPSFGSPFTPVISSTSNESKPIQKVVQQQTVTATQISKQTNNQTISAPKSNIVLSDLKQSQSTVEPEKHFSVTETQVSEVSANDLYMDAMNKQINEFNKIMSATKKKTSQFNAKIGEKEEQMKLRMDTRLIDEVLLEIKENFKNCSKDTTILQSSLIESFALLEEAKSIMDRNVDPKYRFLLKQRALDPITARRMHEINNLNEYIQIQLRELDSKFEQEWCEWLEKRKINKNPQSVARFNSNTSCELIYKALANNQRVIAGLRLQLQKLEGLSSPLRNHPKSSLIKEQKNEGFNKKEIEKLAQSLRKSSIRDIPNEPLSESVFKLKTVPKEKKLNLREFLENRPNVPIRRSIDFINASSSRFISAIEKLKEKQKIVQTIESNKDLNVSIESSNSIQKPNQISNSIEDKNKSTPNVNENSVKTLEKPLSLPIQKLDLKLPLPSFSSVSNIKPQINTTSTQSSNKSDAIKVTDNSQTNSKPPFSGDNSSTKNTIPTFSLTKTITKSITDSAKKDENTVDSTSLSSNISKTVSFGNTTIINPIEKITDVNFKLDTITESTESNETITSSTVSTPFSSFQGFGANISNSSSDFPKLSFNLNRSTTSPFSLEGDTKNLETEQKTKDLLPKYEDISPPTTPQKTGLNDSQKVETISTEEESSKPLSILKTTLTAKPSNQINANTSQKLIDKVSESQSISTKTTKEVSVPTITSTSESNIKTSTVVTSKLSSIPITTTTVSQTETIPNTTISSKPQFTTESQISTNSEQISSSFSQPSFGKTPFASNSFSFGNVSSNSTSVAPSFGQGLTFGGSTGFGQTNSTVSNASTTVSSSSLAFGQQSAPLNSLSFCGLGGGPSPENANKNVFGSAFSASTPQTSLFTSSASQSSPFSVKSSVGSFGGSFSSGTGVAQTGFGAFQQSPQQSTSIFGGSPVFGSQQPAFGGSPTFGGGSPQQSGFGSSPTFGGAPVLGSLSTFGAQTNFGGNVGFVFLLLI